MQFWSCLPQNAKQFNVLYLPPFINKAEIRANRTVTFFPLSLNVISKHIPILVHKSCKL